MTLEEARELVNDPIWPKVRDAFRETGSFAVFPKGDIRRLAYLDADTRAAVARWKDALMHAAEWRTVVDGAKVRELEAAYPGVYPAVFRYTAYFAKLPKNGAEDAAFTFRILKLMFPEAYALCCS